MPTAHPHLSGRGARTRAVIRTLPIVLLSAACNCGQVQTNAFANGVLLTDPSGPETQFTRTLDFGAVRVSNVASHPITLHNNGRSQVSITAQLVMKGNFHLQMAAGATSVAGTGTPGLTTDTYAAVIPAESDYDMTLRFQPTAVGPYTATVIITTTATSTPKYIIDVTGTGAESTIDVCSTDATGAQICMSTAPGGKLIIPMGETTPGMTLKKPLIIKDVGGLTLNVTSIAPTPTTSSEFTVGPNHGPVTIPSMMSSPYEVSYAPIFGGMEQGVIQINSDDPNNPQVFVYLTGTGDAPNLCVVPPAIDFGGVSVGTTAHASPQLTLTSCGSEPVNITQLLLNAGTGNVFAINMAPSVPITGLMPGMAVTLDVTYSPITLGAMDTGSITIFSNAPGVAHGVVPLTGSGVGCALQAQPNPVNFGMIPTGGMQSQQVAVTNTGTGTCSITTVTTSGAPFGLSMPPTATITLPPGQATVVVVTFSPTMIMTYNGTLTFASNAQGGGSLVVPLTGTGESPPPCVLEASPSSVDFTTVSAGTSQDQLVTITNYGTTDCYIVGSKMNPVAPTSSATDFTQVLQGALVTGPPGLAPIDIPSGMSVQAKITFTPSVTTLETVQLEVDYNTTGTPEFPLIPFTGTKLFVPVQGGALPPKICVSPASLNFGTVAPQSTKQLQFTITDCGMGALMIRGLKMEAGSSTTFTIATALTIPDYIQAGASIPITVQYAPTTTTGDFGDVAILSNDPVTPKTLVPLQGNVASVCGAQLACSTDKLVFATTVIAATTTLSLVCTNVGTQPVTVTGFSFGPGTSPAYSATTVATPDTIPPGGTIRLQVDYTPQSAGQDTGTILVNSNACSPTSTALQGTGKVADYPPCLSPQVFSPVQKWAWTGTGATDPSNNSVGMSPLVVNLTDDNGDGLINQNDTPEVLFTTCGSLCCINCLNLSGGLGSADFAGQGMLRAIHGKDGSSYFDITNPGYQLTAEAQLATADLDGDNKPEIIAVHYSFTPGTGMDGIDGKYVKGYLLVFDHTGTLEFETDNWTGDPNNGEFGSAPAIADLNGDGFPEIVFERTVFAYDGTKMFDMAASGGWGHGSFPTIGDINGDGKPEIVSGAYVYEGNGSLLWMAGATTTTCDPTSLTACIGNNSSMCDPVSKTCIMDSGPTMIIGLTVGGTKKPMVVLRDGAQSLHVLDGATGSIVASATWPMPPASMDNSNDSNSICPAPSSAADLDGDGDAEMIIPAGDFLYVFKYNGTSTLQQLWTFPIQDYDGQCGASGSAAFDFEGNGKYDVVYHDTANIWALRGSDGTVIFQAPRSSDTLFETPVIADIDHSGHAAMLMTNESNGLGLFPGGLNGVIAWSNTGNTWPETRGIWSDHAYHVAEITDGDTVPVLETPSWKSNNSWRAQEPLCMP